MWSVLSQLLAPAMVVAISPFSIIVAIFVVLHTDRAPAQTAWRSWWAELLALAAVTAAFLQAPRLISGLNRPVSPRVLIALGGILFVIGVWVWVRRDRMTEEPLWLARFSRLTPVGAAAIGVFLVLANPKMLAATAAAGLLIGTAGVSVAGASGAVVYYSAVASSTVAVPVLAYMAVGARADDQLTRLKQWLHRRSGLVSAVILVAVGITLLFMGISELLNRRSNDRGHRHHKLGDRIQPVTRGDLRLRDQPCQLDQDVSGWPGHPQPAGPAAAAGRRHLGRGPPRSREGPRLHMAAGDGGAAQPVRLQLRRAPGTRQSGQRWARGTDDDRVPLHPARRWRHALRQDDDHRGLPPRPAERRLLPDGQPVAHRRVPRRGRQGVGRRKSLTTGHFAAPLLASRTGVGSSPSPAAASRTRGRCRGTRAVRWRRLPT